MQVYIIDIHKRLIYIYIYIHKSIHTCITCGMNSSFKPPSEVKTVFSSACTPRGTKGILPGARMMSFAVTTLPVETTLTWCGVSVTAPLLSIMSTVEPHPEGYYGNNVSYLHDALSINASVVCELYNYKCK